MQQELRWNHKIFDQNDTTMHHDQGTARHSNICIDSQVLLLALIMSLCACLQEWMHLPGQLSKLKELRQFPKGSSIRKWLEIKGYSLVSIRVLLQTIFCKNRAHLTEQQLLEESNNSGALRIFYHPMGVLCI